MTSTAVARVETPAKVEGPGTTKPALYEEEPRGLTFAEMLQIGDKLVTTGFLPTHIKNGAQAAAIMMTGQELGMRPMRALRSLMMVKGKVTENADSQLARFKTDGGRAIFKELDDTRAVLWLRHPNGDEHIETFTMKDADAAGLTKPVQKRDGNGTEPSMFTKFPKAMLRSRVITAGLKSVGWEGGAGNYDPAELGVEVPSPSPAPPSSNGNGTTSTVDQATGEVIELTLEAACDMVVPGKPGEGWSGNAGTRLADCSNSLLQAVGRWTVKQQNDENGYRDAARLMRACSMVLKARAAGTLKEPPKKEKPLGSETNKEVVARVDAAHAGKSNDTSELEGGEDSLPF